jgi:hypothetical protein
MAGILKFLIQNFDNSTSIENEKYFFMYKSKEKDRQSKPITENLENGQASSMNAVQQLHVCMLLAIWTNGRESTLADYMRETRCTSGDPGNLSRINNKIGTESASQSFKDHQLHTALTDHQRLKGKTKEKRPTFSHR